jgi:capsular polysaccharide biosynthesis protein
MSDAAPPPVAHDLGYYLAPIKRHRALVIAFVLLGLILGAAAAALLRPTYTAVAAVLVETDATDNGQLSQPQGGRTPNSAINMDTEAQIAHSTPVADLAHNSIAGSASPGALLKRLTVTVVPNSTILKLAFTAHSPAAATDGAKAFANAYLQNRRNTSQGILDNQITTTQDQLDAANTKLQQDGPKARSTAQGTALHIQLEQQVANDRAKIASLSSTLTSLQATALNPGTIASEPNASGLAPSPLREIAVATGFVLGLLGGLLSAFVRDRLDPTVRSADDVEALGVPVVAEIPRPLRRRRDRKSGRADREDANARRKANQRVATTIAAALGAEGGSIYLANLSPRADADQVADDLARELGRFGSTVEVAGRGEDSIGTYWDPAGYGRELARPTESSRYTDIDTSLHTRAALALVEQALSRSRFVVIDGLGDFEGLDPYVLSSLGQVSVLVVEPGATSRAELAEAVDQMSMTSCHILGALLWRAPTAANATLGGRYRRVPPRAIEAPPHAEAATRPATGPGSGPIVAGPGPFAAGPTAPESSGGSSLGWPAPAASGEEYIEDAEIVTDDADGDPQWNNAPQQ